MECIVYLHHLERHADKSIDAWLDFRLQEDLKTFMESFPTLQEPRNTVLVFRSLKAKKQLRRHKYYKLNLELINVEAVRFNSDSSFILGFEIDFSDMAIPTCEENELLQSHRALKPIKLPLGEAEVKEIVPIIDDIDTLSVFVKDVGQANWNELWENKCVRFVFDLGAEVRANKKLVQTFFQSRKSDFVKYKPVLIVSHWDLDHIHCLAAMSVADIRDCFSGFICPHVFKTLTSCNLYQKILTALSSSRVYSILPQPHVARRAFNMHLFYSDNVCSLYKGEKSSNINFSGVALFVKGKEISVNYTGDIKLSQAKSIFDNEISKGCSTNCHCLIVPHHGGFYDQSSTVYSTPCTYSLISVNGAFSGGAYGHPDRRVVNYLISLGAQIKRTDYDQDITIP